MEPGIDPPRIARPLSIEQGRALIDSDGYLVVVAAVTLDSLLSVRGDDDEELSNWVLDMVFGDATVAIVDDISLEPVGFVPRIYTDAGRVHRLPRIWVQIQFYCELHADYEQAVHNSFRS